MISRNVFLGLGSNVGGRKENIARAISAIDALADTSVLSLSSCYITEPVGHVAQPDFLNMVVSVETENSPQDLLVCLNKIESDLGRVREERWGPRLIDIDIIYWGNLVLKSENLTVPHPEAENRQFVLQPLSEIAPGFLAPPRFVSIRDLLKTCQDRSSVNWYLPGYEVFNQEVERAHCDRNT